jgi:hypothetical protein
MPPILLKRKANLCKHGHTICPECIYVTDAAKRMADTINGLLTFSNPFEIRNKWMAFALSDGRSDGVLYDTRAECIDHQLDERFYTYICMKNLMMGAKALDCQLYLEFSRQAYDAGMRLHEPNAPDIFVKNDVYDAFRRHMQPGRIR